MKPQVSLGGKRSTTSFAVGYLKRLLGRKTRISPQLLEQEQFTDNAREQFIKLKQKGLSIPVFTL